MKRVVSSLIGTGALFLSQATTAFAQVDVNIRPPQQGINPGVGVGTVLSNALTIVFVAAALVVLFFLIIGAFQWITSGGDKEKLGKARGIIINALIGLAILALAFLIVNVVGQILNINVLNLKSIPSLGSCPNESVFDPKTGNCVAAPEQ